MKKVRCLVVRCKPSLNRTKLFSMMLLLVAKI